MKKGLLLFAMAGILIASSCEKVAEQLDFGIPMTFEEDYSMDIPDGAPNTFEEVMVVDASGNQDVKDNLSNIANFEIGKLTYKVTSFTGDPAIVADAKVQFFNDEGNIGDAIPTGTIEFKKMVDSGAETEIAISSDLQKVLEEKLLTDQIFSLRLSGIISGSPMKADLLMSVTVEAKVKF